MTEEEKKLMLSSVLKNVDMEKAKSIVRKKHPKQAKYLNDLNVVMNENMEGHSEYLSGDYDDSKKYGYKNTIEINPKFSSSPEEIASTIAGETLHHMKNKDPEFNKLWKNLRGTLGTNSDFVGFQKQRQGRMNEMRQKEYMQAMVLNPKEGRKSPYNDSRNVDHFIDASALDEWIRAYQFKDDPIAGKYYDPSWKNDYFHSKYKNEFEGIKNYLEEED